MTRKIALLAVFCLVMLPALALAQDAPKAEVFGGYQYFHANGGSGVNSFNLNGWDAAASGFFNKYFGVTGDFSGSYGTPSIAGVGVSTHVYTYMFGPVVRMTNDSKIEPFAHALFGGAHISGSVGVGGGVSASASDSGFAWAAGGGLDYKATSHISVRLGQFDFLQTHISNDTQNNFRYSGGIVLRF